MSQTTENDIAIVGMSVRVPGANSLDEFWCNLSEGVESSKVLTDAELEQAGVSASLRNHPHYKKVNLSLDDIAGFDATFFDLSPLDAKMMDPQHRHFLEIAWEAFEHAGVDPSRFNGAISVFAGSGHNAYLPYHLLNNRELMQQAGFFLVRHTGNDKDFLATRVSYEFNLKGPSINIQTACSTSLVAAHYGMQSLLNGECDLALVGGVTIEMPVGQGYLYKPGEILSSDGHCRPFAADAGGTLFGSGAGAIILKRFDDAVAMGDTIHAVIKGSAVNNDGSHKVSYMAPSVEGQAAAIHEALALADVDPETIDYVECHGTGTPIGDPIEIAALTQAYRGCGATQNGYCAVGSVKSNIGHLDTAAGVVGLIKTVLALNARQIPPTINHASANPSIDFLSSPFFVNTELKPWISHNSPRRAAVSSLGVGGTNAHFILEEAAPRQRSLFSENASSVDKDSINPVPKNQISHAMLESELLIYSAKTASALQNIKRRFHQYHQQHPEFCLSDLAYSLKTGRRTFPHRAIEIMPSLNRQQQVKDNEDAAHRLFVSAQADEKDRAITFMLGGGGAQYPNMGIDLYQEEPVYRAAIDECLQMLDAFIDFDLKAVMFPGEDPDDIARAEQALQRPSRSVTSLFVTQYANAQLWASWGVVPDQLIGHSMGENTAACLAGVFSLKDALGLVALRGQLFEQVAKGGMLSVNLGESELEQRLSKNLDIACLNSKHLSTVSGPEEDLVRLQQELDRAQVPCRRIRIDIAAHSAMLNPILAPFLAYLQSIEMQAPTIPVVSNVTGAWMTAEMAIDPQYWVKHLRQTVRFEQGVTNVFQSGPQVLIELGPGRVLSELVELHPMRNDDIGVVNSMRKYHEAYHDRDFMLLALGQLWLANGLPEDDTWAAYYQARAMKRGIDPASLPLSVPLPSYPFEHQTYWFEANKNGVTDGLQVVTDDRVLSQESPQRLPESSWLNQMVWRSAKLTLPEQKRIDAAKFYLISDRANHMNPVNNMDSTSQDGLGFDAELLELLASYGGVMQHVNPSFLDLDNAQANFAGIGQEGLAKLYILQTFSQQEAIQTSEAKMCSLTALFDGIFTVANQLSEADLKVPVDWVLLVENGFAISSHERSVNPWIAAAEAALAVAASEIPHLRVRLIDKSDAVPQQWIANEICYGEHSPVVFSRTGRWIREFSLIDTDSSDADSAQSDPVLKETIAKGSTAKGSTAKGSIAKGSIAKEKVVKETIEKEGAVKETANTKKTDIEILAAEKALAQILSWDKDQESITPPVLIITGAFGGLGQVFVRYLGERWSATEKGQVGEPMRLALLGRRVPVSYSTEYAPEYVRSLAERGVEAVSFAVDITDLAAVEQVVQQVKQRWGQVDGVLHMAGVLNDRLLGLKSLEESYEVLAPKVLGANNLEAALQEEPVKLWVNFSSVSALAGIPGQFDYAAANGYLDGFTARRNQRAFLQASPAVNLTVNWPAWRDVGMVHRLMSPVSQNDYQGEQVAHPWLDCLLDVSAKSARFAAYFTTENWLLDEHRMANQQALIPGTGYFELLGAAMLELAQRNALPNMSIQRRNNNHLTTEGLSGLILSDLLYIAPFAVTEEVGKWMMIEFEDLFEAQQCFTIVSHLSNGERVEHVIGRAHWQSVSDAQQAAEEALDLKAIASRCQQSQHRFTDSDHHPFLELGQRWSVLQRVNIGRLEALSELSLSALALESETKTFALHPALLDMAIAGAQAMLPNFNPNEEFYIPIEVAQLRVFGELEPDVFSWTRLSKELVETIEQLPDTHKAAPEVASYDVVIVNPSGQKLIELQGFTLQKISDPKQLMASLKISTTDRQEAGSAHEQGVQQAVSLGVDAQEGLRLFDRILCNAWHQGMSQFIVSPVDLSLLIERLNGATARQQQMNTNARSHHRTSNDVVDTTILAMEAVFLNNPKIDEVVVKRYWDEQDRERFSVHFVVAMNDMLTTSDLRVYAASHLTGERLPQHYFEEDYFEKNSAGEIDRSLIHDPFAPADHYIAPRNRLESGISKIWSELLGVESVSVTDNFYDIGGHSLLAIRAITRLEKRFGVLLNQTNIALQTLEQIAQLIAAENPEVAVERPQPSPASNSLKLNQKRLTDTQLQAQPGTHKASPERNTAFDPSHETPREEETIISLSRLKRWFNSSIKKS